MAHPREAAGVALVVEDAIFSSDVARILAERGILSRPVSVGQMLASEPPRSFAQPIAFAPEQPPTPEVAARLAPVCRAGAERGAPMIVLSAFPSDSGKADDRAAALAYLACAGAVVCDEPDTWLEAICLVVAHGVPDGPRVAIIAPPGSLIALSAVALRNQADALGDRFPTITSSPSRLGGNDRADAVDDLAYAGRAGSSDQPFARASEPPHDAALVDTAALSPSTPERVGRALVIPLVARGELLATTVGSDRDGDADRRSERGLATSRPPLVGLRPAIGAVTVVGQLALRLDAGLGPAMPVRDDPVRLADLAPDHDRFTRQLDKLEGRAGDHETKVLLASWGIEVTRQAVATTPSAATRVAKKAGYPVEVKPWGPDQLSEREGCPVQRDLHTAAEVRRAVAAVARAAGLPVGAPVIVRESPPQGREVSARITRVGPLGWMVMMEVVGATGPAAAPAPLRPVDAFALARCVEATRVSDPEPDRDALADILIRASHLVVHHEDAVEALYLHRVIVAPRGQKTVVVDAQVVLAR